MRTPTPAQLAALKAYAAPHGLQWRRKLADASLIGADVHGDSSIIAKIEYWQMEKELAVTLTIGKVYRYGPVQLQAFNNFRDAESAGKHHNTYFKPLFRQVA
jgi:KTSC domain